MIFNLILTFVAFLFFFIVVILQKCSLLAVFITNLLYYQHRYDNCFETSLQ